MPSLPPVSIETGDLSNPESTILNAKKEKGKLTSDFQTIPSSDLKDLENKFRKHSESLGFVEYGTDENPSKTISAAYHGAEFTYLPTNLHYCDSNGYE